MHDYMTASALRDIVYGLLWLNDRHIKHVDTLNVRLDTLKVRLKAAIECWLSRPLMDEQAVLEGDRNRLRARVKELEERQRLNKLEIADYRKRVKALESPKPGKYEHDRIRELKSDNDRLMLFIKARRWDPVEKLAHVTTDQLMKENKALLDRVHVLEEDKKIIERRRVKDNKILLDRVRVLEEKNKQHKEARKVFWRRTCEDTNYDIWAEDEMQIKAERERAVKGENCKHDRRDWYMTRCFCSKCGKELDFRD